MNKTNNISSTQYENEALIEINELSKSFGPKTVLDKVSLKLYQKENLVILGKSGTGKTVLIKCIVGLMECDSGSIYVFGKHVNTMHKTELDNLRPSIGFLFQSGALYDSMSVKENLEFPLKRTNKGLSIKQMDDKINEALEAVGLSETINKMPSELSGGMRKRISLARTIIINPKIILYDEPTTGLDPVTSDEISLLINEVKDRYKTASIIITHDINCVKKTADRIIMLNEGQVYKEGTLRDFETSEDALIQSFLK
jgi:phospholipid/cholesterol/gamma-HCH transport system ATP-binding protein